MAWRSAWCLAAALLCQGVTQAAELATTLRRPSGGWTYSGISDDPEAVGYAYPNNLIDRGGQRHRTLIEGQLKALKAAGVQRTPTLVVNGNPLPLYTGDDGRFARPYAFGPGSNGVEILDAQGRSQRRIQFYEANRSKTSAKIRIILAWDDPQAELDLHILTPDGQHASFANPVLRGGGGMDLDSVDGAGPEMFSTAAPVPGVYHVYLNYWGNFGAGGYHFDDSTRQRELITARVTLVFDENTGAERRESYTLPMRKIGDLLRVRSFVRAGP